VSAQFMAMHSKKAERCFGFEFVRSDERKQNDTRYCYSWGQCNLHYSDSDFFVLDQIFASENFGPPRLFGAAD
jgi:hypothetical protein